MMEEEKRIVLWDIATQTVLRELHIDGNSNFPRQISLSQDKRLVASSFAIRGSAVWDIASKRQLMCVGTNSRSLQFLKGGTLLKTGQGTFRIPDRFEDSSSGNEKLPGQISIEGSWVLYDAQRILWLPPDYRPTKWLIRGGLLSIGTDSGNVYFLRFDKDNIGVSHTPVASLG
ncbi:WD40 repeat-like protein [Penicillium malachiteum]|nr:WD40 repeat-like protein [Penicillium malachiteum]